MQLCAKLLCGFLCLSLLYFFGLREEGDRDHTILSGLCENRFSSSAVRSDRRCVKRICLHAAACATRSILPETLLPPRGLRSDLPERQLSLCPLHAKTISRVPATSHRKRLQYLRAEVFSINTENSFSQPQAHAVYSSQNGLPGPLNRGVPSENTEAAAYTHTLVPRLF